MHRCTDKHLELLENLFGGKLDGWEDQSQGSSQGDKACMARLRAAIGEAIEVLEESKKAFKSKKLEALRKNLTRLLVESGGI